MLKRQGRSAVKILLCGAASVSLLTPAAAQEVAQVEELVVTGTRLVTGFQAPTPVTTVTSEQLTNAAPSNIADAVMQLPSFAGSTSSTQVGSGSPNGSGGQALLNLRGLGSQRNLVLLNGQRMIATNSVGSVDINMLPQALVRNVEVVTGGASAAYGSDAVTGVINFVLDTAFQGVRGSAQAGVTNYNDDESMKVTLAGGQHFLAGRLRVIGSAEYDFARGLGILEALNRPWLNNGAGIVNNPVAGARPTRLIVYDINHASMTFGGLITNGPLINTQFAAGGAPIPFNTGTRYSALWQSGGDGPSATPTVAPKRERQSAYVRGEYDITDTLVGSVEYLWSRSLNNNQSYPSYVNGQGQYTIFRDNAFLPASIRQRMVDLNLASFTLGRYNRDMPFEEVKSVQELKHFAATFTQQLNDDWRLEGYYAHSYSRQDNSALNMPISRNIYAAADAVVNPANGQIVCRSTLSGFDPGCVPLNVFGDGASTPQAIDFVLGDSERWLDLSQDVAQLNLAGTLGFGLPAGGIALATGVEYRQQKAKQTSDAISQSTVNFIGVRGGPPSLARLGGFRTFNPLPLNGEYNVREAYIEVGAPLLKDAPLAQELDLNAAYRVADYSNSGLAKTWKVGATWRPVEDLRFRLTKSRDIRGANILELFNTRTQSTGSVFYKGVSTPSTNFAVGNSSLEPEIGSTLTGGVVYQPSFAPGLSLSVDKYSIEIEGAIGSLGPQGIIDQCVAGSAVACGLIVEVPGPTLSLQVTNQTLNLSRVSREGIDYEASYNADLFGGRLTLRTLASQVLKDETQAPGARTISSVGSLQADNPEWRANSSVTWRSGGLSLFVAQRYVGEGFFDPALVEGVDINDNTIDSKTYYDANIAYQFPAFGREVEWFFNVKNIFDIDPPAVPSQSNFQTPTRYGTYDVLGRYLTTGVKFAM